MAICHQAIIFWAKLSIRPSARFLLEVGCGVVSLVP